jgi:hypothetical protein
MSRQEKSKHQAKGAITVRRIVLNICAVLLIATSTLAAFTLARPASRDGAAHQGVNRNGAMATRQEDEVQIALSASGFTPTEVAHAAGTFALAVENQDVASEYVLRLKAEDGTLLNEVRVQKGTAVWTVDLAADVYTLSEANHPDWLCQITVQ